MDGIVGKKRNLSDEPASIWNVGAKCPDCKSRIIIASVGAVCECWGKRVAPFDREAFTDKVLQAHSNKYRPLVKKLEG